MNILHINKTDQAGGAAKIAWQLASGQQAAGLDVSFFVADKKSAAGFVQAIKPPLSSVIASHLLGTDLDFFASDDLLKTKEYAQANIIHFHNLHGHYFNLKTFERICREKKTVWTLHDLWPVTPYCSHSPGQRLSRGFYDCSYDSSKSKMKFFNQAYLKWRKRRAYVDIKTHLAVPSRWLFEMLDGTVLADCPRSLICHGVDTAVFRLADKAEARRRLGLPPDKKIILFVSNGGKSNIWKGWQYVQDALRRYQNDPDILFLCLGGVLEKSGQANLRNVGYVNDKELADYYNAGDALLFTSLAESFGLVVIEALACGLPVVSFPVGIVPEVIVDGVNGYIARQGSGEDLIAGLDRVLSGGYADSENRLRQSLEIAQKFSSGRMIDEYIELYKSL